MRYAYGLTSALLIGGATISLITGQPAGAQVAQNDDARITAVTPRAGAPASFADLTEQLAPAVVNISTRQRVEVQSSNPFAGTPFEGMFGDPYYGGNHDFVGWDLLGYPGVRTAVTPAAQQRLEANELQPNHRSAYDWETFTKASAQLSLRDPQNGD